MYGSVSVGVVHVLGAPVQSTVCCACHTEACKKYVYRIVVFLALLLVLVAVAVAVGVVGGGGGGGCYLFVVVSC